MVPTVRSTTVSFELCGGKNRALVEPRTAVGEAAEPTDSPGQLEEQGPVAEAVRFELTEDSHPRRFSRPVP